MSTQKFTFTGKVKWAQVLKPNKFDKYSLQFYPSEEDRRAIKATGTRVGIKEDEDGFFYTFRRDPTSKFSGGAPTVTGNNGKLIGNGSVCEIELEIYDFKNDFGEGKGTRLNSVKVLELVEYNPDAPKQAQELPVDPPKKSVKR